jgi:hypothetical protein
VHAKFRIGGSQVQGSSPAERRLTPR